MYITEKYLQHSKSAKLHILHKHLLLYLLTITPTLSPQYHRCGCPSCPHRTCDIKQRTCSMFCSLLHTHYASLRLIAYSFLVLLKFSNHFETNRVILDVIPCCILQYRINYKTRVTTFQQVNVISINSFFHTQSDFHISKALA